MRKNGKVWGTGVGGQALQDEMDALPLVPPSSVLSLISFRVLCAPRFQVRTASKKGVRSVSRCIYSLRILGCLSWNGLVLEKIEKIDGEEVLFALGCLSVVLDDPGEVAGVVGRWCAGKLWEQAVAVWVSCARWATGF